MSGSQITSKGAAETMMTRASRKSRVVTVANHRSAFTLIEVLVVVAIIALLVSILLPSLSRAREMAKNTLCLSHLKEFGNAMMMYTMDHKDTLPGPLHPAMFTKVHGPPALSEFGRQQHLPRMLRKYFSDKSSKKSLAKSIVDDLGMCPAFPVPDTKFAEELPGAPYPFHYSVNTWVYTAPKQYYFGFIWLQFNTYQEWENYVASKPGGVEMYGPKKVGEIKRAQSEWAIADAFRKPFLSTDPGYEYRNMLKYGGHGSWPREDISASNSGNPLPVSPFHLGKGIKPEDAQYVYNGRVNTSFFDMHAESQRGFRGTVNPSSQN